MGLDLCFCPLLIPAPFPHDLKGALKFFKLKMEIVQLGALLENLHVSHKSANMRSKLDFEKCYSSKMDSCVYHITSSTCKVESFIPIKTCNPFGYIRCLYVQTWLSYNIGVY